MPRRRLDLLVMTHEHLDHIEGFYCERAIFDQMQVEQVWMSLSSHPNYYVDYKNARPQKNLRDGLSHFASRAQRNRLVLHTAFRSLLENNLANTDRIQYLRKLGKKPVAYLARGKESAAAKHWSKNIKIHVLAPEEDTSVYYSSGAQFRAWCSTCRVFWRLAGGRRAHSLGLPVRPQGSRGPCDHLILGTEVFDIPLDFTDPVDVFYQAVWQTPSRLRHDLGQEISF